jgi:hypothetical protein
MGCISVVGQQRATNRADAGQHDLLWNDRAGESLFVQDLANDAGSDGGLIYKDRNFSVSLSQPLSFDHAAGYYVWWVRIENQPGLRMICFWPAGQARYKAAAMSGEIEDLGKLKLLRTGSGSMFLFALAGDGQMRPVSLTNAGGHRLLIDYTATGLIESIRDETARESKPEYDGGRIRAVVQTWYRDGAKYITMANFR